VATAALAKRLVPEFATLSDADVEEWIADATTLLNAAAFGVSWPHACAYFAGHLYLQAQGGAGGSSTAAGPVTSVRDRGWAVTYGSSSSSSSSSGDAELGETIPGRRFLQLRKMAGIGSGRVLS